jgi:hypothetical protein
VAGFIVLGPIGGAILLALLASGALVMELKGTDGTMHPNRLGQLSYARHLSASIQSRLDVVPPVIDPHPDVVWEATSAAGSSVPYAPPAKRDNIDGVGVASCLPASGTQFGLGSTRVTCTASDAAGNIAVPTHFNVIVVDTTPPVIASAPDMTVEATSADGAVVSYASPATSDAVDGAGSASCEPESGSQFAIESTTVTCSATDNAGNIAQDVTFQVIVQDTTAPQLTVPSSIVVDATDPTGTIVTFNASASDVVDASPTVTCSPPSGSLFAIGTSAVTCTATDDYGNTSSAQFQIRVKGSGDQVTDLVARVNGLQLAHGTKASLLEQLNAALASINADNLQSACGQLDAFANHVAALSGKQLTVVVANELRDDTTRIRAVIGCR